MAENFMYPAAAAYLQTEWMRGPGLLQLRAVLVDTDTTAIAETGANFLSDFTNISRARGVADVIVKGRGLVPNPTLNRMEVVFGNIEFEEIPGSPGQNLAGVILCLQISAGDSGRVPMFFLKAGFPFIASDDWLWVRPDWRVGLAHYPMGGGAVTVLDGEVVSSALKSFYSTPANITIDSNPNYNPGNPQPPNLHSHIMRRWVNGVVVQTITTGGYGAGPLVFNNAVPWAVHTLGGPGIIDIAPGLHVGGVVVQKDKSDHADVAYWGPINGPWTPIQGVTIRSRNPEFPARLYGLGYGQAGENQSGQKSFIGPTSIRLDFLEMSKPHPTAKHYIEGNVSITNWPAQGIQWELHGRHAYWNLFMVTNGQPGVNDCLSGCRRGYMQADWQDCTFPRCGEHLDYGDAFQGLYRLLRCTNLGPSGASDAYTGNTFCQIVQRTRLDDGSISGVHPFYGGPPAYGVALIEDNVGNHIASVQSTAAFTIAGALCSGPYDGGVIIRGNTMNNLHGGFATIWCPQFGGMWTTSGKFDFVAPTSGTAWHTTKVWIHDNEATASAPMPNTSFIAISGCVLAQVGVNDPGTNWPSFIYGLWTWSGDWQTGSPHGGPLDNADVQFLAPPLASPVTTDGAWHSYTNSRVKYGASNNPNQLPSGYSAGGGSLNSTGINALEDGTAGAYPPWSQPYGGPAVRAVWDSSGSCQNISSAILAVWDSSGDCVVILASEIAAIWDSSGEAGTAFDASGRIRGVWDSSGDAGTMTPPTPPLNPVALGTWDSGGDAGALEPFVPTPELPGGSGSYSAAGAGFGTFSTPGASRGAATRSGARLGSHTR